MTTIFKKVIFNPLKRAVKWYFTQSAKTGNYICMTGTFPQEYYEMMYEKRKDQQKKKNNRNYGI